MESSSIVSSSFMKEISKYQVQIQNSQQVASHLNKAAQVAFKVIKDSPYKSRLGENSNSTVNFICGMVCKLPTVNITAPSNWLFVCYNIGKNKAIHWSHQSKKIRDITAVDPSSAKEKSYGVSKQDFNCIFNQLCDDEEKDIIILISPIIYNNYDPEVLGYSTSQLLSDLCKDGKKKKELSWSKISKEQRENLRLKALEKALQRAPQESASCFVEVLIQNSLNVTTKRREYLAANPDQEKYLDTVDYTKMQGKMGHGACVAFRVGQLIQNGAHPITTSRSSEDLRIEGLQIGHE
jgi:hypothetical protein